MPSMLFDPFPPAIDPLLVHLAGAGALAVAAANFIAPRMLRYRENLAGASPIVRQIFYVHCAFIVFVLCGQAALCFGFAEELCGRTPLGRSLSAFFALFWLARVAVQLWYYDRAVKTEHPRFSLLFLAAFTALAFIFAWVVLRAPLSVL